MSRNVWETPTYPEVGDIGSYNEYDAEVLVVKDQENTVVIEIFDEEDPRCTELPFVVR